VHLAGYNNMLSAGDGAHSVDGAQGGSSITLGRGNQSVTALGYGNTITLGAGNSIVTGTQGSSTITVGDGNSSITAGGYGNIIRTGAGSSTIVAGAGGATVDTGAGSDSITLSGWSNLVIGGLGHDLVHGGAGNVYQMNGVGPGGGFTVQDFGTSSGNVLDISKVLHDAMQQAPGGTVADFVKVAAQGHDTLVSLNLTGAGFVTAATLQGANASSLTELQNHGAIRL
jgi:Ca2+-binding RTX toxin-like protein